MWHLEFLRGRKAFGEVVHQMLGNFGSIRPMSIKDSKETNFLTPKSALHDMTVLHTPPGPHQADQNAGCSTAQETVLYC